MPKVDFLQVRDLLHSVDSLLASLDKVAVDTDGTGLPLYDDGAKHRMRAAVIDWAVAHQLVPPVADRPMGS